jgi:hypothetical protein
MEDGTISHVLFSAEGVTCEVQFALPLTTVLAPDIAAKTRELAARIDADYRGKGPLVLVGILKGGAFGATIRKMLNSHITRGLHLHGGPCACHDHPPPNRVHGCVVV